MKKHDFIVVAVVLAVVGVLAFFLYFVNSGTGKYVRVEVGGTVVDTIPLSSDCKKEYDFDGNKNTLVVSDGKASVSYANCRDGICSSHKPISRNGESIICLPHDLVVSVVDDLSSDFDSDSEIDAVV